VREKGRESDPNSALIRPVLVCTVSNVAHFFVTADRNLAVVEKEEEERETKRKKL
jgi:hypothetical protein